MGSQQAQPKIVVTELSPSLGSLSAIDSLRPMPGPNATAETGKRNAPRQSIGPKKLIREVRFS